MLLAGKLCLRTNGKIEGATGIWWNGRSGHASPAEHAHDSHCWFPCRALSAGMGRCSVGRCAIRAIYLTSEIERYAALTTQLRGRPSGLKVCHAGLNDNEKMTEQQRNGREEIYYNNGFHEIPFFDNVSASERLRVDFIKQTNGPNPRRALYRPRNS